MAVSHRRNIQQKPNRKTKDRKECRMEIIAIIPAQYDVSRFPGKPLADIFGMPMIWWAYQSCMSVPAFKEVIVVTDDSRIFQRCEELNIHVIMTSVQHKTGTDLVCEAAKKICADLYVNIQGDEPLLDPMTIAHILEPFQSGYDYQVCGLMTRIKTPCDLIDPTIPKVITNKDNNAVYLTRSSAPFSQSAFDVTYFRQVCVCAFTLQALEFYSEYYKSFGRAKIEAIEDIDILRFIEGGIPVHFIEVATNTVSVDTPVNLEKAINNIRESKMLMKNATLMLTKNKQEINK